MTTLSPKAIRAGKARDLLIAAGMSAHIRPITREANEIAGDDDAKYMAHVMDQIAGHMAAKATVAVQRQLATLCARDNCLRYLIGRLTQNQKAVLEQIVTDIEEMTTEGYASAYIAHYLQRTYPKGLNNG